MQKFKSIAAMHDSVPLMQLAKLKSADIILTYVHIMVILTETQHLSLSIFLQW